MRVRLIKRKTIEEYVAKNAMSRPSFKRWLMVLSYADWSKPEDIVFTYPSADVLGKGSERVVFDIGGNKYRMIGIILWGQEFVFI